jgi:hypothetical protein
MTRMQTASGVEDSETYMVNVGLPNQVGFMSVKVSKAKLGDAVDVLIGMDIITSGDFSITNQNRNTIFSFRVPSGPRTVRSHRRFR